MSAVTIGCPVPLSGEAGTGLCNWALEHRHAVCAAHRRRKLVHGDYRGHIPVIRKPSRRPEAVQARREEARRRADAALKERDRQHAAYVTQVAAKQAQIRGRQRIVAALT